MDLLAELVLDEHVRDDDAKITAAEIQSYLSRVAYNKRNKMNPLYNRLIVAGFKDGKRCVLGAAALLSSRLAAPPPHPRARLPCPASHLGYVDLYGTTFSDDYIATGYGNYMALPLIRDRWRADLSEGEARALLEDCMRVLWYRDTRALNKIQLAKITAEGTVISEPYAVDTKWNFRSFVQPKASIDTGGSW